MQRSIRGATTIVLDTKTNVITATKELLQEILIQNSINIDDIVNIIFTATSDIRSGFPAEAARDIGLKNVLLHWSHL